MSIETIAVSHSVSNLEKNTDEYRIKSIVRDKIVQQLAHKIAAATIKEDVQDFSTTYHCRLVVADVDDFWRLVEKKAWELHGRIPNPPVWVKHE